MPSAAEITRHHDPDPDEDPWVQGLPAPTTVALVPSDPSWPDRYAILAAEVRAALGAAVLDIDHVGSTAVPGLAAKDVIDIDLTVADPKDEATYIPALEAIGWRHVIREPSWHEHRALSRSEPHANLHVFGPDCPETIRHRMFRDWLRSHPDDRERYETAKRAAVPGGGHVMDYNPQAGQHPRNLRPHLPRGRPPALSRDRDPGPGRLLDYRTSRRDRVGGRRRVDRWRPRDGASAGGRGR